MDTLSLTSEELSAHERDPRNWKKPSLAVIAYSTRKTGIVLWSGGPHVQLQIEIVGSYNVDDLGFDLEAGDDFPEGISVWEGVLTGGGYNPSLGDCDDTYLTGSCRAPTDAEWLAIRAGKNPWNQDDWMSL